MRPTHLLTMLLAIAPAAGVTDRAAADSNRFGRAATYEVTVTNATRDQRFTPLLVVSHDAAIRLFQIGSPASPELATLAEEGSVGPLRARLEGTPGVRSVATSAGLLAPGASSVLEVEASRGQRVSLAAMLIPTNDAFVAVNAAQLPIFGNVSLLDAVAYDAGSERNDELCSSIPGPEFDECGGDGGGEAVEGGEEGFVHIHNGIHGVGDFDAAKRDWRNPVARVSIRRIR